MPVLTHFRINRSKAAGTYRDMVATAMRAWREVLNCLQDGLPEAGKGHLPDLRINQGVG